MLEKLQADSGITPKSLQGRVELDPENAKFLEAYHYVSHSRGYNDSGRQPFLISEIRSYLAVAGISGVESSMTYLSLLQSMDRVALNYYHEKQKRESKT